MNGMKLNGLYNEWKVSSSKSVWSHDSTGYWFEGATFFKTVRMRLFDAGIQQPERLLE